MNPIIIGISGKKRCGKDTLADMLKSELEKHNLSTAKISIAKPMKEDIAKLLSVSLDTLEEAKNDDINVRMLLQSYGQSCVSLFGRTYWIDRLSESLKRVNADIVIIPDVRRVVEADFITSKAGLLLRVERHDIAHSDLHQTENELDVHDGFLKVVNNSFTDKKLKVSLGEHARLLGLEVNRLWFSRMAPK